MLMMMTSLKPKNSSTKNSTLQVIALDAKIQVDFDPIVIARSCLIGYENRGVGNRIATVQLRLFLPDLFFSPTLRFVSFIRKGFNYFDLLGALRKPFSIVTPVPE